MAFYGLEPFGDEWRQTGTIAAASRSPHMKRCEDPTVFYPFQPRKPEQNLQQQIAVFNRITADLGTK